MKSGSSFSESDYKKGDEYVNTIINKIYKAGVKGFKNPRASSHLDNLNAKFGDIKLGYGDDNHLNIAVKSSGWVSYKEALISKVDYFIFKLNGGDYVCIDPNIVKNKLKKEADNFNLETSRGAKGSKEDYEKSSYRTEDPKQPKKLLVDLGYRFDKADFPKSKLITLEVFLNQDFLHRS